MKVKELIETLKKENPDAEISTRLVEDKYDYLILKNKLTSEFDWKVVVLSVRKENRKKQEKEAKNAKR